MCLKWLVEAHNVRKRRGGKEVQYNFPLVVTVTPGYILNEKNTLNLG